MTICFSRRALLGGAALVLGTPADAQDVATAQSALALAALAEGGTVALIRHAHAPGTGDPPGFRLGDCPTQRNLDEAGRRQAAELGRRLREAGVLVTQVRSSRWCRAFETASLAFPDQSTVPDASLDSFFADPRNAAVQTRRATSIIAGWRGRQGVHALVTHAVNITALTGLGPEDGEVVVVHPRTGGFDVVGRWR